MNFIHLAAAGELQCLFWGIVIAIFIIAQIAKSKKKHDEAAPKQGAPPSAEGDPAEELKKFLEGLGQAQKQPPPPPPPPVAVPPPPPPPHRRVATHRAKPRVAVPPPPPQRVEAAPARVLAAVPEETSPDEAAVLARFRAEKVAAAAAATAPARPVGRWRAILTAELRSADRHPARKAFVLKEVLGAPVALRRREIVYPVV